MSTQDLYNAVPVVGQMYKRASLVTIENTLNGVPRVTFHECDVVVAENGSAVATLPNDSCTVAFDSENPLHVEIYTKLNELYILAREARDLDRSTRGA